MNQVKITKENNSRFVNRNDVDAWIKIGWKTETETKEEKVEVAVEDVIEMKQVKKTNKE